MKVNERWSQRRLRICAKVSARTLPQLRQGYHNLKPPNFLMLGELAFNVLVKSSTKARQNLLSMRQSVR